MASDTQKIKGKCDQMQRAIDMLMQESVECYQRAKKQGDRAPINKRTALKHKCGALRDLVAFVQFKKREKYPWRSVSFSKVENKFFANNSTVNMIFSLCF